MKLKALNYGIFSGVAYLKVERQRLFRRPEITTYVRGLLPSPKPYRWHVSRGHGVSDREPVSAKLEAALNDLRDAWEHDHPEIGEYRQQARYAERQMADPPPHVIPAQLEECDCGRAHPTGYVCVSAWRDSL